MEQTTSHQEPDTCSIRPVLVGYRLMSDLLSGLIHSIITLCELKVAEGRIEDLTIQTLLSWLVSLALDN
ncbi:hypothetical protein AMECASPLE_004816 [Ameca splendens]|uniref:Uncharacterized protein n=1 Tax=Ameca splendens TaxID=208324 RepID=A0ABV0ZA01_9TELE